jgi:DtxR family Mn-dependent transcriptional regulator
MSTADHLTTESEEMYLITIARAMEDGEVPPVAVSTVAKALGVSSVSANQMIKKLETLGLLAYVPYKGVSLTPDGETLANSVLRSRRLWGFFLSEHLGLSPERADEVACEMEHITPGFVADRLAAFLGEPEFGPTGKPIPAHDGDSDAMVLTEAPTGVELTVASVTQPFDVFMESQGASRGATVTLLAKAEDGSAVVATPSGTINLAPDAAGAVSVRG